MRPLASPRLTALAISAALTLGAAAPAFADEARPSRPAAPVGDRASLPDADGVSDALAAVQKAVAGLLAAVSSGNVAGAVPQLTSTLTSLVDSVVATALGGGGLPGLAGLPALPALPGLAPPDLPVDAPVNPPLDTGSLPVDTGSLPVDTGSLPVKPPLDTGSLPVTLPAPAR